MTMQIYKVTMHDLKPDEEFYSLFCYFVCCFGHAKAGFGLGRFANTAHTEVPQQPLIRGHVYGHCCFQHNPEVAY